MDKTSIQRHKDRWHKTPEKEVCTFVPGSSPEISMLKMQYSAAIPKGRLKKEQKSHGEKAKLAVKDSESSFFNADHEWQF